MRLFSITFLAHEELMQIRGRKNDAEYVDAIWLLREPVSPKSKGPWPMQRPSDTVVMPMQKRVGRSNG